MYALALRLSIGNFTQGIWPTSPFAWIHAPVVLANRLNRAIFTGTAMTLLLTSLAIGIANQIRWTLANWVVMSSNHANGRGVTQVGRASLNSHALHVGNWISPITRWTLTHGLVIVGNAHSVYSTGTLVAGVEASVSQSVAELRGRTVDVVDAWNGLTTAGPVVWITGKQPWWTLTVALVIVDHAQGVWSARDEITDWLTAQVTLRVGLAGAIFRTLAVGGAFVPTSSSATLTIVWIALVARQTLATRSMILGQAQGVLRAGESVADLHALQHTERIDSTGLVVATPIVADAIGHCWYFAERSHRVP